jgi:branched-chain amino acid transport system ATP-binding protein
VLCVEDLHASYGKIEVLKGISFEVERGELVTLIGTNGAGKSTTLRAISGLLRPSGRILLEGEAIQSLSAPAIVARGISQVPEGRQLFGNLTVFENLEMGSLRSRDHFNDRLEQVYELFPILADRGQQLAGTLSGGEQQMLAIGRGLMSSPRLLLLDEPSLGLSPVIVDNLVDAILPLKRDGLTILLVEQNATEALEIADFAYVLEVGRTTLSGPAKDIAADPRVREAYLGV